VNERLAKRLTLLRPVQRLFKHTQHVAITSGCKEKALIVEVHHDAHEPSVLTTNQVPGRHLHIIKMQRRGIRSPPSHFVQRCLSKTFHTLLNQHQRNTAHACFTRPHGNRIVICTHTRGDEGLLSVQHIMPVLTARHGLQVLHVRSTTRLSNRQSRNLLTCQHRGDHPRLQLIRAKMRNRRRANGVAHQTRIDAPTPRTP